ncbi:MAG: hypothetical protein H0X02_03630 [Nitrosomonas sp.]|nr:hypothetical protein [Nitrosomonas sp.]
MDTNLNVVSLQNLDFSLATGICLKGTYANVMENAGGYLEQSMLLTGTGTNYCWPIVDFQDGPDVFDSAPDIYHVSSTKDRVNDAVNVYYYITKVAATIYKDFGYRHNFMLNQHAADYPHQIPVSTNFNGVPILLGFGGVAFPKVLDLGWLGQFVANASIGIQSEFIYRTTIKDGQTKFIAADFSRVPSVTYHEYGHTVLYGYGFVPNEIVGRILHEGYSDYLARFTRKAASDNGDVFPPWLLPDAAAGIARTCYSVFPSDSRFVAFESSDPTLDLRPTAGRGSQRHFMGQAVCQALAGIEEDGVGRALEWATYSIAGLSLPPTVGQFYRGLIFQEANSRSFFSLFFSQFNPRPKDRTIQFHFELHGITYSSTGSGASIRLNRGNGANYGNGSDTGFVVATGKLGKFNLEFARNSDGSDVCHEERASTTQTIPTVNTRWYQGEFSYQGILNDCFSGVQPSLTQRLYINVDACNHIVSSDCDESINRLLGSRSSKDWGSSQYIDIAGTGGSGGGGGGCNTGNDNSLENAALTVLLVFYFRRFRSNRQ